MIRTAHAYPSLPSKEGLAPSFTGLRREIPVVADDPLIAEALAIALSGCGVAARAAISLPWRNSTEGDSGGAALVVLGGETALAARRTVAALVGEGRRVAVVGGPRHGAALAESVEAGAEAVVPGSFSLNDLATLVWELGRDGPVMSPVDLATISTTVTVPAQLDATRRRLESLTSREREILAALMAGRRAAVIAQLHFVSLHTVRTQLRSILRKLDVHSQVEAVALAHQVSWSPIADRG